MWGNKNKGMTMSRGTTLISSDTVIIGDIQFSGTLDVEGLVQGNISARDGGEACVRVVDKGRVEGDIFAPSVVVNGVIEGDVHATGRLELASRARVQGNVYYSMVEMAAGSEVNGALQHMAGAEEPEQPAVAADATIEVTEVPELPMAANAEDMEALKAGTE